jgi:hypothetical protein
VSLIFWHSLLFTATTPISRWFSGRWRGEASLFLLAEKLLPTWMCDHLACNDISLDYLKEGEMYNGAPVQNIDRGFGLHAAFSLLWLVAAYLTIVHSRRWGKHKQFGRLALVAFALHVFGAVQNLSANVVRHQPISQLVLLRTLMTSIDLMSSSMSHVFKRKREENWLKKHQDDMVLCYLISIQGAGPIRAVSHIQGILGFGSVQCQALHSGMATNCSLEYVMRMLFTYWWTLGTQGLYVRLRNDTELMNEYKSNVRYQFWITLGFCLFTMWSGALPFLAIIFGEAGSWKAVATVVTAGVVDLVQTTRKLKARHFPAPVKTKTLVTSQRSSCARTRTSIRPIACPEPRNNNVG